MEQFADLGSSEQARSANSLPDIWPKKRAIKRSFYRSYADNFLSVTPEARPLPLPGARARKGNADRRIRHVDGRFHLLPGNRTARHGRWSFDWHRAGSEQAERARANLAAADLDDLVDIRVGDARETLSDVGGEIDLVLLDGAFSLYLPILKLLEPQLKSGTLILAENAFDHGNDYLAYVRNPANGYLSQSIPVSEGRGNEFTVVTR